MDTSDTVPGLLRGPVTWALETHALSVFSAAICTRILEKNDRLSGHLIARARSGIAAIVASRIGGDCWSALCALDCTPHHPRRAQPDGGTIC